jgi:hypothetical protein
MLMAISQECQRISANVRSFIDVAVRSISHLRVTRIMSPSTFSPHTTFASGAKVAVCAPGFPEQDSASP